MQLHQTEVTLLIWYSYLSQVTTFVNGLFETRNDLGAFKNQLRDFLIQSKEFSAQVQMIFEDI